MKLTPAQIECLSILDERHTDPRRRIPSRLYRSMRKLEQLGLATTHIILDGRAHGFNDDRQFVLVSSVRGRNHLAKIRCAEVREVALP